MSLPSYEGFAKEWAEKLSAGGNNAHRFLEKPAIASLLPDLSGKRVLSLGCGSGEETDLLFARGAQSVLGIDLSSAMIQLARERHPRAEFLSLDMNDLSSLASAGAQPFDFCLSSLALHYLPSWEKLLLDLRALCSDEARFLFSTHHPVKWGSKTTRGDTLDSFFMGYERPKDGSSPMIQGDYLTERPIQDVFFGQMEASFFHRPLEALFADILASPWRLEGFHEPRPVAEAQTLAPAFHAIHTKIPLFAIFLLAANPFCAPSSERPDF